MQKAGELVKKEEEGAVRFTKPEEGTGSGEQQASSGDGAVEAPE
jgi:hypothetical protein